MSECTEHLKGRLSVIDFEAMNARKSRERMFNFDPTKITNQMIENVLNTKSFESIKQYFNGKAGLFSKLQAFNHPENVKAYRDMTQSAIDYAAESGKDIGHREVSIAITTIMDAINSEQNVIRNAAKQLPKTLSKDKFRAMFHAGESNLNASTTPLSRVYSTIGKKVFLSQGLIISKSATQAEMENEYYEIGKRIVDVLTNGDKPLFTVSKGYMVTRGLLNNDGSYFATGKDYAQFAQEAPVIYMNLAEYPEYAPSPESKLEAGLSVAKSVTQTALPAMTKLPSTEANTVDQAQSNVTLGDSTKTTLNTLQATAWTIKPAMLQILRDIKKAYDSASDKSIVRGAASKIAGYDTKMLESIFGLTNVDQNDVFADSEVGKMITKTNALEDILQNLDQFIDDKGNPKEMFFTYFMSRNDRLHQLETVMNFQADKYLARQILTTGVETYTDPKDIDYFINAVQEDLGKNKDRSMKFSIEQIKGIAEEENTELEKLVAMVQNGNNQINVMKTLSRSNLLSGSIWKQYALLSAIADIRKASANGFKGGLKSDYMVESDATASGVLIKLLQEAGRDNSALERLKDLGLSKIGSATVNIKYADVYAFMGAKKYTQTLTKEEIADPKLNPQNDASMFEGLRAKAEHAINLLSQFVSERDVNKMFVMKFNYHQSAKNLVSEFGDEHAKLVMQALAKHGDLDNFIAEIMKDPENTSLFQSTPETQDQKFDFISSYLQDTVADYMIQVASDVFSNDLTKESDNEIKLIGEASAALAKASNGKYTMAAPAVFEYLKAKAKLGDKFDYNRFMKRFSIPMTKVREVVLGKNSDGVVLLGNQAMSNTTSMFVNIVHSMDKAILLMAYENFIAKHPEYADKSPMFIHDAAKGNATFNRLYDPFYRSALMEVSMKFDIVEAHLQELERAMEMVDKDSSAYAQAAKLVAKYKESTQARIALREAALKDMELVTAFGQYESTSPKVKESKSKDMSHGDVRNTQDATLPIDIAHLKSHVAPKDVKLFNLLVRMNPTVGVATSTFGRPNYSTDMNNILTTPNMTSEQVLHEFIHAATIHNIHDKTNSANVKATARLVKIMERANSVLPSEITKLWNNGPESDKIEEFMAYGLSNPDVIAALQEQPSLWEAFKTTIMALLGIQPTNSLYDDLLGVLNTYSKNNIKSKVRQDSMAYNYYHTPNPKDTSHSLALSYTPYTGDPKNIGIDLLCPLSYTNRQMATMLNNKIIPWIEVNSPTLFEEVDKYASTHFAAYDSVKEIINDTWEHNEFLQQMRPYLNMGQSAKNTKAMLTKMMNIVGEAEQKKSHQESADVAALDKIIQANFSDKEIVTLDNIFGRAGLGAITKSGLLQAIAEGSKTIDEAISDLNGAYKGSKAKLDMASNNLAELYINGKVTGMNMKSAKDYFPAQNVDRAMLDAMTALKALKLIPDSQKLLNKLNTDHHDLYSKLTYYSMAIATVHEKLFDMTGDNFGGVGNIVEDVYDRNPNIQAISFQELKAGKYPLDRGWKILQEPIEGVQYGIVYNHDNVGSYQAGLGTNISHIKYGLEIRQPDKAITSGNYIQDGSTISLMLTPEQKAELGLIQNPAHTLVRTYARLQYAAETNKIREELMDTTGVTKQVSTVDEAQKIYDEIKANRGTDKAGTHPWFIKLDSKLTLSTLPADFQKYYKLVENASDIGGFDNKVQLVRKDLASQVMGYKEMEMFPSSPMLNKMANVVKKLIVLRKIHQVVANPFKLAVDITSNTVLLAQMGVPMQDIVRDTKEALEGIKGLVELRNQVIAAEFEHNALGTPATEKAMKDLQAKLSKHLMATAVANGFVQSMGTDLLHRNYDTVSGLQRDINEVINKAVKNPDGSFNKFGDFVNSAGTFMPAFSLDTIAHFVGKTLKGKGKSMDAVAKIITNMADGYEEARTSGDPAKYLSQFIAAPDSELVKAGSGLMQYGDFTARWVYYKYLKNSGVSEKDAAAQALETFIDYRVNMPKELKMLSDYGILMYPTYWTRIQKIIYIATLRNPVTAGLGAVTEGLLGNVLPTIYDSNIITKATSWNGLINSPTDAFSGDTFLPTHLIP